MPEYPDLTIYLEALSSRIKGERLGKLTIVNPFFLRSVEPPPAAAVGKVVVALSRIGKRIVWELEGEVFLVIHLMISGRFHLKEPGRKPNRKITHAVFEFSSLAIHLTEASTKKRASLHLCNGRQSLGRFRRGGIELFDASETEFRNALLRENRTLKRALTDPDIISAVGNAYSDEILHRARLSPLRLTSKLTPDEISRLFDAARRTLTEWTDRLRSETGVDFPEKVTAFHPDMAVHGRYRQPCPVCGTSVQRISYAENECNYCPRCQTEGSILSDRSLSRLLKADWPRTIDELERKPGLK